MNHRKVFLSVAVLATIIISFFMYRAFSSRTKGIAPKTPQPDEILYRKDETWKQCPSGSACSKQTVLYKSGRMIVNNQESRLPDYMIRAFISRMVDSGIFNTDCPYSTSLDYSSTTTLYYHGVTKTIQFPSCERQLRQFEQYLP